MNNNIKKAYLESFSQFEVDEAAAEKRILKIHASALDEYKSYFAKLYEKYEDQEGKLTYDEMLIDGKLEDMDAQLKALTVKLYSDTSKEISSFLDSTYKKGFNDTSVILKSNNTLNAILKDDELYRAVSNEISGLKWTERMGLHRQYAVCKIRESVVKGMYEGETYAGTAKRLNDSMNGQVVNPLRIIRTESPRVFSQAKKDRLDKVEGMDMIKEWLTSQDEAVRSNHSPMNGKKVRYNDNFILPNGNSGFAPCMIGAAADDIQCRCLWITRALEEGEVFYRDYTFSEEIPDVYDKMVDGLDGADKDILKRYTGGVGQQVNSEIRSDMIRTPTQEKIDLLNKALEKTGLPEDVVLKRGTILKSFTGFKNVKDISQFTQEDLKLLVGTSLSDRAFISTGLLKPLENGREVIMTINAPKGTKGVYMEPVAYKQYKDQYEILLKNNCTFLVKDAIIKENKLYMEVDLYD